MMSSGFFKNSSAPARLSFDATRQYRSMLRCGSPPRAWRRLRGGAHREQTGRFTSTRVETLLYKWTRSLYNPVHLHARGDAFFVAFFAVSFDGSPPRAWRRCNIGIEQWRTRRFTSTRVETLAIRQPDASAVPVHLHARGDADVRDFHAPRGRGSPPRAWRRFEQRIFGTLHVGSPPRAWRRSDKPRPIPSNNRFTSTRVETLNIFAVSNSPITVHLHARGDARRLCASLIILYGSPPRAWRRSLLRVSTSCGLRFTSTRVETLSKRPLQQPNQAVHLHARGDASGDSCCQSDDGGSPPRAWRRFSWWQLRSARHRFTSTRVETLPESS